MNFIKSQLNKLPKDLIIFIDGIGIIPVSYISSKEENLKLYITLIYFLFDGKNSTIELKEINCKTYLIQKKNTKEYLIWNLKIKGEKIQIKIKKLKEESDKFYLN